jgi:hypothetical protein
MDPPSIPAPPTDPPRGQDVLDRVYALHAFHAENADELSFEQGEWVDVVERDDEFGDGWWRGRVVKKVGEAEGEAVGGLFPASYVGRGGDVNEWLEMQRGESQSRAEREESRAQREASLPREARTKPSEASRKLFRAQREKPLPSAASRNCLPEHSEKNLFRAQRAASVFPERSENQDERSEKKIRAQREELSRAQREPRRAEREESTSEAR